MKTQKWLTVLATLSLFSLSVSCGYRYEKGFAEGKAQGYSSGYDEGYGVGYTDGDADGFERGKTYFETHTTYENGYDDGHAVGTAQGYASGYAAGELSNAPQVQAAYNQGYSRGYNYGYDDGLDDGYDNGYDDGVDDGYDMGYSSGVDHYYDVGYDDGFDDGYDVGYDDGYYGGLSVGKSKSLQGYANLLSMAHNDMFDYAKIAAPKSTARGIVANGKLLFEETSLTNKDTLKRAAVIEQYLVVEMAKQVKGKFGLSADRSLKIAKAANHFRKFSSQRALTSADTNSYVTEIIGVDLKTIEAAHESGNMKSVLEAAASKNGTTPEKMAEVLAKHFI